METNDALIVQIAAEIARLRFEVGALLTGLERLGTDKYTILQAVDVIVHSSAFDEEVQRVLARLQGHHEPSL